MTETAWNSAASVCDVCICMLRDKRIDAKWWQNDGKERKEQKINLQLWRTRQTARERGPDAAWEGYLIYHITPLFPFSLTLVLHSSLPPTSLHVSTRVQTIFALSPPYRSMTSPPPMSSFTQKAFFLPCVTPTINEAVFEKVQKCQVGYLRLRARLQINAEELQRRKLGFLSSVRLQQHGFLKGKHLRSSLLHSSSFGFSVFLRTRVEIFPWAFCNSPRK